MTGSGSSPIVPNVGARFVQEVNAVTMAVEDLHPDVGSVIELGGQDAKIIMFRKNEKTGDKAGHDVDERQVRVRHRRDHRQVHDQGRFARRGHCRQNSFRRFEQAAPRRGEVRRVRRDGHRQSREEWHSGPEIMNSLADAIVTQNLSVLTRVANAQTPGPVAGWTQYVFAILARVLAQAYSRNVGQRGYAWPKDRAHRRDSFSFPRMRNITRRMAPCVYGLHEAAVGRQALHGHRGLCGIHRAPAARRGLVNGAGPPLGDGPR
jgi:hypothetical protein